MEVALPHPDDTDALGARLAALLRRGDVVLLQGPLGAGKSSLARALLRTLSGDRHLDVPSPTFTLVQEYDTPLGPVHHWDLWRLAGPEALPELGWDDAETSLVEWPDRLGPHAPAHALSVSLAPHGTGRVARLHGWDDRIARTGPAFHAAAGHP